MGRLGQSYASSAGATSVGTLPGGNTEKSRKAILFELNPNLNVDELRDQFSGHRRGQIPGFAREADAAAFRQEIDDLPEWNLVFHANGRHFDLSLSGWNDLPAEKRTTTEQIIHGQAQNGFSYFFENYPLHDQIESGKQVPTRFADAYALLNDNGTLSLMREVTGEQDIAFADAQVTRFGSGHFLTNHNDHQDGKNRRLAYVWNLTPDWRADWGGYLQFFDQNGNVTGGFLPTFNCLNVFKVPADHAVSYVTPFAGAKRVSMTGWLRAR
ncbi:MAG: 2OG-Fe(II) oxygenase family protein [Pseudomonadota bacterium]